MEQHDIPPEWAQLFEGKTCGQIMALSTPPEITPAENARFERALTAAANAANLVDIEARKALLRAPEETPSHLIVHPPHCDVEPAPSPPLVIPEASTDVLLERQIASCAGLIEHIIHRIARRESPLEAEANFMDRMASLMNSSATLARAVGRYRGLKPAETCHRSIIERVESPSGR
jgi:hypothetical protein